MKQIFLVASLAFALAACNSETKDAGTTEKPADASGAKIEYPYTPAMPYRGWKIGSEQNTVVAMNALKGWADKDYAKLEANIGDSLDMTMDGFKAKMSKDSAMNFMKTEREKYTDVTITMYDWESVISADKKHEYVTLWYKQVWTDMKGVKDSLSVVDDCKIENGKMIELDEKIQRFPAKK